VCFATRLTQGNFDAADCGLGVTEDGTPSIEFSITDRDGSFKTLTVNQSNWGSAYDSWLELYRKQVGSPS
jgi:hypothetical protein